MSASLAKRLRALRYPRWKEPLDQGELHVLICWLEEQKIRLYPEDEREGLRSKGDRWGEALSKYLSDLQCPPEIQNGKPEDAQDLAKMVEWLTSYAIQWEYRDSSAIIHEKVSHKIEAIDLKHELLSSDYSSPEFAQELKEVCSLIGLQVGDYTNTELVLRSLAFDISTRFSDSAIELAGQRAKRKEGEIALGPFSSELGFTSGSQKVDKAAAVLRFLNIITLRQLQALINELISLGQLFTADPKTDQKLGKVGV